jgi:excinuclease ABC subunit B
LRKKIADITDMLAREDADTEGLLARSSGRGGQRRAPVPSLSERAAKRDLKGLPAGELADLVAELTDQMHGAAAELQFETAARLRDEISDLKKELRQMLEATR